MDKYFKLKPDSLGDPDVYLGAELWEMQMKNGVWAWALSLTKYVHQAVKDV